MEILGLDVGGSGIKGAMVDTITGTLLTDRYRIDTPDGAEPYDVVRTVQQICQYFAYQGQLAWDSLQLFNMESFFRLQIYLKIG